MALHFDGISDQRRCSLGNCNQSAAITALAVVNLSNAEGRCLWGLHNSSNECKGYLLWFWENAIALWNGTTYIKSPFAFNGAEGICLVGAAKATGTVKPLFFRYKFSTKTWTFQEGATTLANAASVAGGTLRLGEYQATEFLAGNFFAGGIWGAKLSQAEIEALIAVRDFSEWVNKSAPKGIWLGNQNAVTEDLLDLTGGGANQSSRSGTTIVAEDPPLPYTPGLHQLL